MARRNSPISFVEAETALYLDFEGLGRTRTGDEPSPVVAGVVCEGKYQPYVLRPQWGAASEALGYPQRTIEKLLQGMSDWALSTSRRIVYWTSAESKHLAKFASPELGFDVRILARKVPWIGERMREFRNDRRRYHSSDSPKRVRKDLRTQSFGLLSLICEPIGLSRPAGYGAGLVGKWIRQIETQSSKNDYSGWSPGSKGALTRLLKHNEHDCRATQHLLHYLLENR